MGQEQDSEKIKEVIMQLNWKLSKLSLEAGTEDGELSWPTTTTTDAIQRKNENKTGWKQNSRKIDKFNQLPVDFILAVLV